MSNWKTYLNADPIDWLLEEDNPSVRYFTLKDIMGKSQRNSEVQEAKASIMQTGVVPRILAKQRKGGNWDDTKKFYTGKYKSTVWSLIILAELGADGGDKRIKNACEFILEWSQDRQSGGFAHRGTS
ncbi:MAG: nitrogen fixation protein NifH, partial [Thermoplasmata archaeon]|nr:nitrogen fixation protein NifH [Thermoplasmata archaeon]